MKLTILVKRNLTLVLAACGLILSSCSGLVSIPTGIPTSISTEIPTPTILWFPSTDTPTPFLTQSPVSTEEFHPGVGDLIFFDSFDQPELWNTSSSMQAGATVTRNRLVLSISEPGPLRIISLRSQPVLGDFYTEAMVDISLCNGLDQYGIVFRVSSENDLYRFTVNCSGQLRLERVRGGETYPLLDWLSSGDAPLGAPAQVKLGVWAVGREMRVFLNDHFQFSQSDTVFSSGTIGFFLYAGGNSPVTISFSDMSVYSVFYISPTPSMTPSVTPIPTRNPNP